MKIGSIFEGGIYAGISAGINGGPDHHLVLMPTEFVGVNWQQALDAVKAQGWDLPTRAEQALLFANLKHEFEPRYYWSSEQAGPSDAWCQYFYYGLQDYLHRSYEGRARAVLRFPIKE